jgi:uncharacterized protein
VANTPIKTFIDARDPAAASLAQAFAEAEAVLVTDDSSSMVSEAISAGLPTVGTRPLRHTLSPDEAGYRAYLQGNQWYCAADIDGLTPEGWLSVLGQIKPLQQDPLERLGDLIMARIPRFCTNAT